MAPTDSGEATLGTALRQARESKGLTLNELAFQIRPYLPEQEWVTGEAIRAYEKNKVRRVNFALLVAMSKVLEFALSDLSPEIARDAQTVSDLLVSSLRCFSESAQKTLAHVA